MGDEPGAELPVLTEPADGLPEVVDTAQGRRTTLDALAAGSGPIAMDVERAQATGTSRRPTWCSYGGRVLAPS